MKNLNILFLLIANFMLAQVTLKVTAIPSNTPAGSIIHVAGSFNNWTPAGTTLSPDGSGNYTVVIPEGTGSAEFKFTRGSWSSVEGNGNGQYLANRTFTFTGSPQTLNLTIQSWEDLGAGNPSTAAANVHILNEAFYIPQLNKTRKIWIYLPPDYETSSKRYPVIYMQDGQNLFDNSTAFAGEWQIDETLNTLFSQGDYGAIVIGIDNGGGDRINEYTPWNNPQYGGGQGDQYMQFIAETLKPYVDANYRTRPDKKYNALIGSSLGALISNYGGIKYSGLFSKIGSFSPAYWIVSTQLNDYITSSTNDLSSTRIYFVAGQNESSTMASDIEQVKNNMQSKGLAATNTLVKLDSYGQHNENYWKGEFAAAYQWLFQNLNLQTQDPQKKTNKVVFMNNRIFVEGLKQNADAEIYDYSGKLIEKTTFTNGWTALKTALPKGIYHLKLNQQSIKFKAK